MNPALHLARGYAICIGTFGFLFGQLFVGDFSIAASVTGLSGLLSGILSWLGGPKHARNYPVAIVCLAGTIAVFVDAYDFYSETNIEGSDYAWLLIGPFVIALLLIAYSSLAKHSSVQDL